MGSTACNDLVNDSPQTTERRIAEDPPATGAGGTVVLGKYFQTEVAIYTGPGGSTTPGAARRQTVTFAAGTTTDTLVWQVVRLMGTSEVHETYLLTFSADTVTFRRTCPASSGTGAPYHYTFSNDTWSIWFTSSGANRETFVRQP